jgi:transcriptional regulator with XRE-family HTH domain
MLESFGARLRQRREEQGIALATIAEESKIKLSLLESLERDDVSHWPSGIFRRAFIRAYAHAIGLDPDVVVREFLDIYPEPIEDLATPLATASGADGARINGAPPIRLRYLVDSAIGSLSRLRRSSAGDDPVTADRAPVTVPILAQRDLPPAESPSAAPGQVDQSNEVAADRTAAIEPPSTEVDFQAVAHLCTELGRVQNTNEVQPLLQTAAGILDAIGLVVWVWDGLAEELRPALAHGYSDTVLVQLPTVRPDADNATAAAFRSAQTCAINGSDDASGALAVPLLTPAGCGGVLAIELQHGGEQTTSVRAAATLLAAQLAQLIGSARPAEVRPQAETVVPPVADFTTPIRRANVRR